MRRFSSRRRRLKTSMLVVYRRTQPGRCRPGGNGNRRYLPAAGETSPDRNPAAGHHASRGALLDRHGIPQLCDCLPARNSSVAGGRRVARQARPKRGSGRAVLTTARATAAERPRARNRAVRNGHPRQMHGPEDSQISSRLVSVTCVDYRT